MVIKNELEFARYKAILDKDYKHEHFGTPEKYPCEVIKSQWHDNIDSLDCDYYIHEFSYDLIGE